MKYLKKIIIRVVEIIFTVLIVGTVLLNTVYSLRKAWNPTYMLKIGNVLFCQDEENAMEPNIKKQDLIVIKKTKEYETNDIIVYIQNEEIKVRRITGNSGNNLENIYTIKGDNNFYNEPYEIYESQIKGKVVKSFRGLAFALRLIESKTLLVVNTVLLSIIVYYRIKIRLRTNKKRKIIKT